MKVVNFSPEHSAQLYGLIRNQNKLMPPYVDMSDNEIATIIANPSHFSDLRYPKLEGEIQTYLCVQEQDIVCAAQVIFLKPEAYVYWFVANPKYNKGVDEFISYIEDLSLNKGCNALGFTKNSFGMGWAGIPDCWDYILEQILSLGFKADDIWESFWSDNSVTILGELPSVSIIFKYKNKQTINAELYDEENKIGEAAIWLPSELSSSLKKYGIADLEYIEIYKEYRKKGYGKAFIFELQKKLKTVGFDKLMLWTEVDNLAMKRLSAIMNFTKGPTLYWI